MEKFDMAQFLADAGVNLDTGNRKQVADIPIDRIVPDPNNFYELSAIDDLAENIALFGLQQPIVVRPMPEDDARYIIVSGHRRHAALKKLIEEDGRDDLREVMCIVERGDENPKLNQLKLIYANASTRVLSSAEQAKQAEQVEKLLYELKEDGMEFPGRMRDHVAAACQMSTGKLARLKVIRDGLAAEFVPAWESGALAEATAYELARMPQDEQSMIFSVRGNRPNMFYYNTVVHIAAEMVRAVASIPDKACPASGGNCAELDTRKRAAAKLDSWESLRCKDKSCCLDCSNLQSCTHSCNSAKAKRKELRDTAKAAEAESAKRIAESRQPVIDAISASWQRAAKLAENRHIDGKSLMTASRGWSAPDADDEMDKIAKGAKQFDYCDRFPGNLDSCSVGHLISVADLLGCSIDYLLGRTDTPTIAAAPAAEPEKCVNIDTWHTGHPNDPGEYVVYIRLGCTEAADTIYWTGRDWDNPYADIEIIAWTYPPKTGDNL